MLVTHFHLDHCAAVPYVTSKTPFKVCCAQGFTMMTLTFMASQPFLGVPDTACQHAGEHELLHASQSPMLHAMMPDNGTQSSSAEMGDAAAFLLSALARLAPVWMSKAKNELQNLLF